MLEIPETISQVSSGVVCLAFFKGEEQVGTGSGFLSNELLITNSHVIRPREPFDAVEITFGDQDSNPIAPVRFLPEDLHSTIIAESLENEFDYAVLKIDEPEFRNRAQFKIRSAERIKVGEQVLFFGFPFGSRHLTSHVGYISAEFWLDSVHRLQIDGSINPGNSGGPLLHLSLGTAIAIVTRTQTGLEKDFDELLFAIERNVEVLRHSRGKGITISMAGIDPLQSTQATMTILGRLAKNLKRTANVGIGYAFCAEHILATGLFNKQSSRSD